MAITVAKWIKLSMLECIMTGIVRRDAKMVDFMKTFRILSSRSRKSTPEARCHPYCRYGISAQS